MRPLLVIVLAIGLTLSNDAGAQMLPAADPEESEDSAPEPAPAPPSAASAGGEDVITPLGAVWRSALIPGWGQRYKGERTKGWTYTGIAAGLLAATAASYQVKSDARRAYQKLGPGGDFEGAHERQTNGAVAFTMIGGFTGAFWAFSIGESAFNPLEHLRIKDARVKDVFPAIRNHYETSPIATISLENRSSEPVNKVRVRIEAQGLLDVPGESQEVESIPPGLGKSIPVTAAFGDGIFSARRSEPVAVPARITIEYEVGRKKRTITRTATFTVYDQNAIVWDDMRKLASFVTPRDEGVRSVASGIARRKTGISSLRSVATAAAYFDALSAMGITYVSDPQAPFAYFDGNAEAVDSVNYPRETLVRRTGDCDDLSALYAALLESSGVATAFADVPGHVFVLFDSGLTPEEMERYLGTRTGFLTRNGSAWIPVETTAVGKSFSVAWRLGEAQLAKWGGLGKLETVEIVRAQVAYAPAPPDFGSLAEGFGSLDESRFAALAKEDATRLTGVESKARREAIAEVNARKLEPAAAYNEVGIIYARDGKLDEAVRYFTAALQKNPAFSKAHNNLGNIAFLRGDAALAEKHYERALASGGDDPAILANLAALFYDAGDAKRAREYFQKAARLAPVYTREYPELAALLRDTDQHVAVSERPAAGKASIIGDRDPRRSLWSR